jgi:hypothetical protein
MQGINSRRTLNGEVVMEDEIITTDVPETSEELEEVNIDTSQDNETEETQERDIEKEIEERANQLFEEKVKERLDRYKKSEKENLRKYKYLEDIVKTGTGTDNLDDAINETVNFYKGNGLEIPEYSNYSEDRERRLGRSYANDFIDLSYKEIEEEANRIANIPRDQRTVMEEEEFNILGAELTRRNNIEKMKAKGYDTNILETKEFKDFSNQFNESTDISKIYEMYKRLSEPETKPASAGSAKSEKQPKETFSPQSINEMSPDEMLKYWNNPEFRKIAGLN